MADEADPAGTTDWPRVGAQDGALVAAVNAATGLGLSYAGRLPGGNAGAALARLGDADRVLTRADDRTDWPRLKPELDRLRAAGCPVPRMDVVPLADGGAATVQERMPGAPSPRPTPGLVAQLIRLVGLQAGAVAEPRTTDLYLDRDGPGFCLHEPARAYDGRTRELVEWVESVEGACVGRDLLHLDLHLGNVLADGDTVTGVVDWTGPAYGDRRFDLVTLGFDLTWHGVPEAPVLDHLGDLPTVRPYVAHMALRLVDWTIRHNGPEDVAGWLRVADRWRTLTG